MNGNPYDSDQHTELIDETSPYYDLETDDEVTKERKQNTAKVKSMIKGLGQHAAELIEMQNNGASLNEMRTAIEERFDVPGLIDYIIHNLLTNNMDGCERNFQCFTYDGYKWYIAPYDLDGTFGYHCTLPMISLPTNYVMGSLASQSFKNLDPMSWAFNYFKQDMYDRYAEIRNKGLLSAENIISLFDNWYYSFGEVTTGWNMRNGHNRLPTWKIFPTTGGSRICPIVTLNIAMRLIIRRMWNTMRATSAVPCAGCGRPPKPLRAYTRICKWAPRIASSVFTVG